MAAGRRPDGNKAVSITQIGTKRQHALDLGGLVSYLHAMAIRPIIETPDPLLRTISTPVEAIDAELQTLIDDMFETMYHAPGIGLAAIQVGVPRRVLVVDLQEPESDEEDAPAIKNPMVFINPQILDGSPQTSIYKEGCLSVPEQYAEVERPATIRASWMDRKGAIHEEELEGLLATCLQHEMDHLEGILFIDHLSRLKRDMVLKKLAKSRKAA
jgi:peptide deformylase